MVYEAWLRNPVTAIEHLYVPVFLWEIVASAISLTGAHAHALTHSLQSINWSTNRQSEGWHLQLSGFCAAALMFVRPPPLWCWEWAQCTGCNGGLKKVPTRDIEMNSHSLSDSWQASHVDKSIFKSPCLLWCWQRSRESMRRIHLYFQAFWSGSYPKSRGREWTKKMRWSWLDLLYNDGDHTTMKMAVTLR